MLNKKNIDFSGYLAYVFIFQINKQYFFPTMWANWAFMLDFDLFVSFCYLMEESIKADSSGMDTHNYHVLHIIKAHCKSALRCCHFSFDGGRRCDAGIITMSLYKYPEKKQFTTTGLRGERVQNTLFHCLLCLLFSTLYPCWVNTPQWDTIRGIQCFFSTGFSRLYMQHLLEHSHLGGW